jgi:hypothetical protein
MSQPKPVTSSSACGGTLENVYVDTAMTRGRLNSQRGNGLECLINHPSNDSIDTANDNYPTGPIPIIAHSGPLNGKTVSTSHSIANFPIIDNSKAMTAANSVQIIGYLQGHRECEPWRQSIVVHSEDSEHHGLWQ